MKKSIRKQKHDTQFLAIILIVAFVFVLLIVGIDKGDKSQDTSSQESVSNQMTDTGNAYACINEQGLIFKNYDPCN